MSTSRHETVHRLFTEAIRLPSDDRSAFVEQACADDEGLRAEVEAMLAQDARTDGRFAAAAERGGVDYLADAFARDGEVDAPAVEAPERLAKYRILRKIGEGGMGIVYEAEQDDPQRRVALKVIRTSMVTRGVLQRFHHEARVLGHLRHPGIAQIYEAGTADTGTGGQPYFAMELVEGESITDYAETHGLGTNARLELLAQLCDILEYAHRKGVIHRDIKPPNVLVMTNLAGDGSTTSGRTQLKVLDFGVARATDADLHTVTLQTTMGQLVGTVPYMSPEQASGDPAELDTRSDVYSVAVLGWELLTGRLPYDVRGKMVHEAVRVIREEEASRLSVIDRSLRGDVETIFAKALEKEKDRRYQSSADLAEDIRRHLAHEPIAARPASTTYQLRKFARRNKTLVAGVVATLVVAIAGAVIATKFAFTATQRADDLEYASYRSGLSAAAGSLAQGENRAAENHLDELPPTRRGWEYDYLRARLKHHADEWETPVAVACGWQGGAPVFDAAGERMFAVRDDHTIGVWEVATGELVDVVTFGRPREDQGRASALPGEPDSSANTRWWRVVLHAPSMRFAATTREHGLAIHDLETGELEVSIPAPAESVAFDWDLGGGRLLHGAMNPLHQERGPSQGISFDLRVWDGRESRVLGTRLDIQRAVFDPSGERVFESNYSGVIRMRSAASGAILSVNEGLLENHMFRISPRGEPAVFGLFGNDHVLDADSLDVVATMHGHQDYVTGAAWVEIDGREHLATSSRDGALQVWDRSTQTIVSKRLVDRQPSGHRQAKVTVGVLPDGDSVVVAGERVRVFPLGDPSVLRGHESFVYRVAFSPDGRLLVSSGFLEQKLHVWDVSTGRRLRTLSAPKTTPGSAELSAMAEAPAVAFSADGRRLVAGTGSETLQWDVTTFEPMAVAPAEGSLRRLVDTLGHTPRYAYHGIAESPDGHRLADVRRRDAGAASVGVFDITAGATYGVHPDSRGFGYKAPLEDAVPLGSLVGHEGGAYCVVFSPDGTRIATGGIDATVRIWDAETYEQLLVLRGHENYVKDIAFSPDGTLLASASGDFTVRLWDTLPLHERRAMSKE